jgi:hypothetical protein
MNPLTETCELFLKKIGRTRKAEVVFLIGILADALDDADHPAGKRVRRLLATHQRREDYAATANFGKRSFWTRPRFIGSWRQELRRKVGRMFGKRWSFTPNHEIYA